MQGCQAGTIRHHVRYHLESILIDESDGLFYVGEVIQHILYPCGNGKSRFSLISDRILRFGQPQQIGNQPFLIHSVRTSNLESRSHHTAILGSPFQGVGSRFSISFHTFGKYPKITVHFCFPIHRPAGCHHSIFSRINDSCTHNFNF